MNNCSRVIISGLSGDSGKTVVTCGLIACLRGLGLNVSAFKKGPDYIDAAWLALSSDKPARNLDTFLMGSKKVKESFVKNACRDGINVIEGNRGLFDGVDNIGTHSTAELAKLLQSPVVIVLDISKVTRTAAALILGCKTMEPGLKIAGVILNRVAGERHEKIVREAIEGETGIPVIGAIPKLKERHMLPSRHLGLITPDESAEKTFILTTLKNIVKSDVNYEKILDIANDAPSIKVEESDEIKQDKEIKTKKVKIGYFKDKAFSFYYPENLEVLVENGAQLIPFSSIQNNSLNDIDALYIGGGFPETNLNYLINNREMLSSVKRLAEGGLPIYAECGGLMYLAKEIAWNGKIFNMSGVLPISVSMHDKPQGHGYCEMTVDSENPFYKIGTELKGHEFHYSKIYDYDSELKSCLSVSRGKGCFGARDGLIYKNVFTCYMHIHALATPEWKTGLINCALNYKVLKTAGLVSIN